MPVDDHGPGVVGITSDWVGRYREFDLCLSALVKPKGTHIEWMMGRNIASNLNKLIQKMNDDDEWIWILNDDHVFSPHLLIQLLDRQVDVILPVCLSRVAPFNPVIFDLKENDYKPMGWGFLDGKSGMIDVSNVNLGGAGLLVRRNILEIVPQPWFACGQLNPETLGEDIYFYEKLREYGIPVWMELDYCLGHISNAYIWAKKGKNDAWFADVKFPS